MSEGLNSTAVFSVDDRAASSLYRNTADNFVVSVPYIEGELSLYLCFKVNRHSGMGNGYCDNFMFFYRGKKKIQPPPPA